jgi:hypothetical protein
LPEKQMAPSTDRQQDSQDDAKEGRVSPGQAARLRLQQSRAAVDTSGRRRIVRAAERHFSSRPVDLEAAQHWPAARALPSARIGAALLAFRGGGGWRFRSTRRISRQPGCGNLRLVGDGSSWGLLELCLFGERRAALGALFDAAGIAVITAGTAPFNST